MDPAASPRVFVGLVPPAELARALVDRAGPALLDPGGALRAYPAEHVHLTLAFLGEVPERRLAALDAAVERAARGAAPLALRVRGTGGFPDSRSARVAWAGAEDADGSGALSLLHARLVRELAAEGLAPADAGRPFRPHLTLGRARGRGGVTLSRAFLALALDLAWTARELLRIESRLDRPGAERYPVRARCALGGG